MRKEKKTIKKIWKNTKNSDTKIKKIQKISGKKKTAKYTNLKNNLKQN